MGSGQDCNKTDNFNDDDEFDDNDEYEFDDDFDVVPFAVGIRQCCSFWHREVLRFLQHLIIIIMNHYHEYGQQDDNNEEEKCDIAVKVVNKLFQLEAKTKC